MTAGDRVSYVVPTEILGVHVSYVPKLIVKGHLTRHEVPGHICGHLDRADVVALRDARLAAADAVGPIRRRPLADRRPDADHEWLTPPQAGRLTGITAAGVHQRIRRGRLPATWNEGRWWVRRDLLEQVEAARLAAKTRRP